MILTRLRALNIGKILLILSLATALSAREQVNMNFSNLEIKDFISLVSKITNKNILMNNKVDGTVNLISNAPIYDDELMDILVSVLEAKGFTLMKTGSLLEVVRSVDAAKYNAKVATKGIKLSGPLMVTQAITVEGDNVDEVAAKIRYLISKTAKLMTMKDSNTLLVTDYPKNIETIKQVIKDLSVDAKMVVKILNIKNAELKKLQNRLIEITKSLFNEKIETQKVKIILDDNINGLIVVGNDENVKKVEELVKTLDTESSVGNTIQIFELKNSDAKAVLATLNEIIAKQVYTDPALKPNLSMSEEINAIIAVGDPTILKGLNLVIEELDKEKFQVYVQARIVEINKSDSENLGFKYGFDGAKVSSNGGLYSLSSNFGGNPVSGVVANQLVTTGMVGDITGGFALGATLDFLEENGASKALSNPSILCVNNKESSIYVGKTISISSGQTSVAGSTTASYKREDVGLTLKIKPRVSSKDKVTLEVEVILENITDDGLTGGIPVRQPETSKQEVKTQAILRHGENIIIGGLVKIYDRKIESKVPFFGDIWIIGDLLFSSTSTTLEQDNLVVILTPYVIDKSEKLSQLQKDLGVLAKLQKEYNVNVFNDLKKLNKDEER